MIPRIHPRNLSAESLVPFVGAGTSRALLRRDGSPAFPTWQEFIAEGASQLHPGAATVCLEHLTHGRLVEAAKVIRENLSGPRWLKLLRSSFDVSFRDLEPDGLRLQKLAWQCSDGLVVTTNFDRALGWGAPRDIQHDLRVFGLEAPLDLATILNATVSRPVLWHLHGRIESPGSLVISPDGYGQLYGDDPTVPKRYAQAIFSLRHVIATHSLLFVGFSLNDAKVVGELQRMHQLFDESDHAHYVVVRTGEISDVEERIIQAGLTNIELIEVADFGRPLERALDAVAASRRGGSGWLEPARSGYRLQSPPVYLRRRCRSVLVGSESFRRLIAPCIAEHRQQDSSAVLVSLLAEAPPGVERRLAAAVRYELDGAIELMADISDPGPPVDGPEWATLALFHAIGQEKLKRIDSAIRVDEQILATPGIPDELRLCAEFNRAVCLEKAGSSDVGFEQWISDRARRLSTRELVWTKAFNMQLVLCARTGRHFEYADLLDEAIAAEIGEASTGMGKTILNWANYSGTRISRDAVAEIWRVAGRSSVNVRVAMLSNLREAVDDSTLSDAIDSALEAGAALSHQSATVLRMLLGNELDRA